MEPLCVHHSKFGHFPLFICLILICLLVQLEEFGRVLFFPPHRIFPKSDPIPSSQPSLLCTTLVCSWLAANLICSVQPQSALLFEWSSLLWPPSDHPWHPVGAYPTALHVSIRLVWNVVWPAHGRFPFQAVDSLKAGAAPFYPHSFYIQYTQSKQWLFGYWSIERISN